MHLEQHLIKLRYEGYEKFRKESINSVKKKREEIMNINKNNLKKSKTNNDFIIKGFGESNFNHWLYLFSQLDFYDDLFKKYYSIFANSDILENAINEMTYLENAFKDDFANNVTCWKNGTGKTRMQNRSYNNHHEAVSYLLDWLNKRREYLNKIYL